MFIDIHTHSEIKRDNCISLCCYRYPQEHISFDNGDVLPCAAIHPWDVEYAGELDKLEKVLPSLFAIAEIGLDKLHKGFVEQQLLFTSQLRLALKYNMVAVIHSVRSHNEVLQILKDELAISIIHSFIGNSQIAARYIDLGCYISISPLSLSSSKTLLSLKEIPLSRLFIESDDTGVDITDMYTRVADILSINVDTLQEQVFNNFKTLFKDEFSRKNRAITG